MKTFKRWLANKLAGWARRIYPESEEVMAFHMDRMTDYIITGQSRIKIVVDPEMPADEMEMRSGKSTVRVTNLKP